MLSALFNRIRGGGTSLTVGLVLLTVAALALRLVGIGHGLPQRPDDDDSILLGQASVLHRIWTGEEITKLEPLYYPVLVASCAAVLRLEEPIELGPEAHTLDEHLTAVATPHLRMRILVAVLSALSVPAMYWLARCFLGRGTAWLAAAFLATNLLHLDFSQQARPHAPAVTFGILALAAILRARSKPERARFVVAGICAGLACATLQTGAAVLLPLGLVGLDELRRGGRAAWPNLFAAAVPCVVLIALAYMHPHYPSKGAALFSYEPGRLRISGHPVDFAMFDGGGFAKLARFLASYDPVALAFASLGVAALAWSAYRANGRRPSADAVLLGAHAIPYVLVFGLFSWIGDRFALPLVPHVALLAGVGVERLANALPNAWGRARLALVGLVALALPTAASIGLDAQRTRVDTATQAARFVEANLSPKDDLLFLTSRATLPLALTAAPGDAWPTSHWFLWEFYLRRYGPKFSDVPTWTTHRLVAANRREDVEQPKLGDASDPLARAANWPVGRRWAVVSEYVIDPATDPELLAIARTGAQRVAAFGRGSAEFDGPHDPEALGRGSRFARALFDERLGLELVVYRW
ncbi:MAG: phospholipid carrier-dependent glycosyltransferase [Planctomycetes bacterium]|nr:phospholipid carrier-dependent glycosyltransferase [Planctomycetota bacterium]